MVTLKKTQVKVISILIAFVFFGSVVAIALSQSSMLGSANAASSSSVGVIEYRQVLSSSKTAMEADAQIKKLAQEAETEFNQKSAGMSENEKAQYYQQTMARLQQKQTELTEPVVKEIENACKEVADAQGLEVVLLKDAVVFGGKDVTNDVIKKLNK